MLYTQKRKEIPHAHQVASQLKKNTNRIFGYNSYYDSCNIFGFRHHKNPFTINTLSCHQTHNSHHLLALINFYVCSFLFCFKQENFLTHAKIFSLKIIHTKLLPPDLTFIYIKFVCIRFILKSLDLILDFYLLFKYFFQHTKTH